MTRSAETLPEGYPFHSALRYLWARRRIEMLSDYNKLHSREGRVKEVTELGLAYNLLTAYKKWKFSSFKGNREVKATVTLVIEV